MRYLIFALCLTAACDNPVCQAEVNCGNPWMTGATCCIGGQYGMCVLGDCSPQSEQTETDEGEE